VHFRIQPGRIRHLAGEQQQLVPDEHLSHLQLLGDIDPESVDGRPGTGDLRDHLIRRDIGVVVEQVLGELLPAVVTVAAPRQTSRVDGGHVRTRDVTDVSSCSMSAGADDSTLEMAKKAATLTSFVT
jgi:hypothetical protein